MKSTSCCKTCISRYEGGAAGKFGYNADNKTKEGCSMSPAKSVPKNRTGMIAVLAMAALSVATAVVYAVC